MKKIGHYLGNIAGAILAFTLYMLLEIAYFAPKRINLGKGNLRVFATSLMTVVILFVIFYLYRRQLKEENLWGFNESPHWDARRLGIAVIGFILIVVGSVVMLNLVGGGVSENQQSLNRLEQGNTGLFKILVILDCKSEISFKLVLIKEESFFLYFSSPPPKLVINFSYLTSGRSSLRKESIASCDKKISNKCFVSGFVSEGSYV